MNGRKPLEQTSLQPSMRSGSAHRAPPSPCPQACVPAAPLVGVWLATCDPRAHRCTGGGPDRKLLRSEQRGRECCGSPQPSGCVARWAARAKSKPARPASSRSCPQDARKMPAKSRSASRPLPLKYRVSNAFGICRNKFVVEQLFSAGPSVISPSCGGTRAPAGFCRVLLYIARHPSPSLVSRQGAS